MNVKLNQKISEVSEVKSLTVVPSAGDESTVLGACLYGYLEATKNSDHQKVWGVKDLYLGTEYCESEISKELDKLGARNRFKIEKPANINIRIAKLLAENNVVARMDGRMEFGARALGNRSILANPSKFEQVKVINEMIKNRDFWMPFAASVLEEDAERYFINPKKIPASFMAITFNTRAIAWRDLQAAIHPYDRTCRPQIVSKSTNPAYYEIINEFKKLTGIGGILNTSFNLHGEPNVESVVDALHTLNDSGLSYLALGPFLISKKSDSMEKNK
jgi:carbamoyltransferase